MGVYKKYYFAKNKDKLEFVFSTYLIVPNTINKAIICTTSTTGATQTDIGFSGGIVDTAAITTYSAGGQSYCLGIYDQTNNMTVLRPTQLTQVASFMFTSTNTGTGLNYLNDTQNSAGVTRMNVGIQYDLAHDFIVQYVMSNSISTFDGGCSFHLKTTVGGRAGVFTVYFRVVGTDYVVSVKDNFSTVSNSTAQKAFIFPKGTNATVFNLFTFTKIGGVVRMYKDGVEITTTTTPGNVYYGITFMSIGVGVLVNELSGIQCRFKTLSLFSGKNLTNFDLTSYINKYKTIHGI